MNPIPDIALSGTTVAKFAEEKRKGAAPMQERTLEGIDLLGWDFYSLWN